MHCNFNQFAVFNVKNTDVTKAFNHFDSEVLRPPLSWKVTGISLSLEPVLSSKFVPSIVFSA